MTEDINYVFSDKVEGFKKAFPEIKTTKVEFQETGYMAKNKDKRTITEQTMTNVIPCSNLRCSNGGVSIEDILRDMSMEKKKHWEGTKKCQGQECSKGYVDRECNNFFKIKVDIEYKK